MSWREYWNSDTPIYVNDRHKRVHYERVAADILALVPGEHARVLDYGCGEALAAERLGRTTAKLYLCDGAELVRQRLGERFGRSGNITVLAPEEMGRIAAAELDLIVVNSLVQYLSPLELQALLAVWRSKLKPSGRLLVADVIPPDVGPVTDVAALLRLAAGNGFLLAALVGLARTALSGYARMRAELGLARFTEAEMIALLTAAGFSPHRHRPNLGHNQARMAFMAVPA